MTTLPAVNMKLMMLGIEERLPRLNGYCGFYRKSQKRDRKGRFTKA